MRATRAVACMLRASWSVIISSSRTVLHYPEGMTITITLRLVGSHHPAMLCLLLTMNTHNLRSHHVTCSTKCEANATTTRQPIKKAHGILLCRFGSIMTREACDVQPQYTLLPSFHHSSRILTQTQPLSQSLLLFRYIIRRLATGKPRLSTYLRRPPHLPSKHALHR
jgi:hypothetical protein